METKQHWVFVLMTLAACASCGGETTTAAPDAGDSSDATVSHDGGGPGADASLSHDSATDTSITLPDVFTPDAGPPVVSPCADASQACQLPASVCIDDSTLKYYTAAGGCSDSGTCTFEPHIEHCPPSGSPPDCYQGGCRITVIR